MTSPQKPASDDRQEPGDGASGADEARAHDALISHLRHELRTPVNAILGYGEMLLDDLQEAADRDERHQRVAADLAHIIGAGRGLLEVINSVLHADLVEERGSDFDVAAAGAQIRHELRDPLNAIVGYCELLQEDAPAIGRKEMLPDLERIHTAARKLESLIENLVGFTRAEAVGAEPAPVNVELVDLVQTAVSAGQTAAARPSETPGGLVLVVDDNEMSRDVLRRRLVREGYSVVEADSGRQTIQLIGECSPDLVLLDIVMPGMSGFSVLQHLKADAELRDIPVIMVSALEDMASVVQCIELGAEDYLPKPFDPVLLRARAGACVEKKHLRDGQAELHRQLQASYDQLRELESLRDSLTGMIVHDLRTPLASIMAALQTMGSMGELDDLQQEMLAMSIGGCGTLLGMINDLLDISKMETGSLELERAELDPAGLAERCVKQVGTLARKKGLDLRLEVEQPVPALAADEDKLRRTLVNLLGNSIKFTPQGGVTLSVRHDAADGTVCFAVCDTGEGIPRDAFERIFEKFGQVETRQAGRKMSTGLGLTFCKMVAEAHGGRIWVESELGVGSVFSLAIPLGCSSREPHLVAEPS
ncbi:response regulator [bacterium]|nr:response regulator [bacterium]